MGVIVNRVYNKSLQFVHNGIKCLQFIYKFWLKSSQSSHFVQKVGASQS